MGKKRWFAVVLVLALSLSGLLTPCLAAEEKPAAPKASQAAPPPAPPKPVNFAEVGAPLPPLSMKAVDGSQTVALDKLGKPAMFMFVNSACSACRLELSTFSGMAEKLKEKLDVFVVTTDFDVASSAARLGKAVPMQNYILLDGSDFKVAAALGFNFTPATVIVNGAGKQVYRKGGFSMGDDTAIVSEVLKVAK
jgi:thiol-disulfide isomerase/thioredoxin